MEIKFFYCKHCGNIIRYYKNSGVPAFCCGEKMTELVPNTVDAAHEKHLPVISVDGNTVRVSVGSVAHPMTAEHHIGWIVLVTGSGVYERLLSPDGKPEAVFTLAKGETVTAAYAYCNLHGLWKSEA